MYIYVQSAGLLKGIMSKLGNVLKGTLAEAFTTDKPKQKKVKDPDTGAIGNLYIYEGKKNGATLNVEMYPFPGAKTSFVIRCYLTKNNKLMTDTVMILNPSKGKAIQPISAKKANQEIAAYCEMFKKYLGVRKMKEAQQDLDEELNKSEEDDGFEASQYDDEPEDNTSDDSSEE